ncbi:MAG: four helix bundle protein [Chitinophagaceae bacterium]|jgi:four helix bundle protein|nr:four helix bundle protein [Chitinophagaceae bacterium]
MHNFRELKIWQRSVEFVTEIYKTLERFPTEEKFGLISQLKRCAVSIPSNISEGAGRSTNAQFKYFLEVSMGSCNEVITQLEISSRLGFIAEAEKARLSDEAHQIYKMILGFYNTLS